MWLSIATGLINLLEKAGEVALVKILRQHSDQLLAIENSLIAANQAFMNETDNRDDLEYVELIKKKAVLEAALAREVALAQKQP